MEEDKYIVVTGAREHNLKGITVRVPVGQLTVITGVSGSGKSSLALDTLYAEGQRRYVECVSPYAKQFLERMPRPNVLSVEGIRPAVSVEQKNSTRSARSTVGTATETYDFMRLLFARIGKIHCYQCGDPVEKNTVQSTARQILSFEHEKVLILFARAITRKENLSETVKELAASGYARAFGKGEVLDIDSSQGSFEDESELLVVQDRITVSQGSLKRITDSLESAFREGGGKVVIATGSGKSLTFHNRLICKRCGIELKEPEPLLFSFNSPFGACPSCRGFGDILQFDIDLIIPDKTKSIMAGAIAPWRTTWWAWYGRKLSELSEKGKLRLKVPFKDLSEKEKELILHGDGKFDGVIPFLEELRKERHKASSRFHAKRYLTPVRCGDCGGSRLRKEALFVKVGGFSIDQVADMPVKDSVSFFGSLKLSPYEGEVARRVLDEIKSRLKFLKDVGVGYLALSRAARTLSGGEAQRIALANALGSSLTDTLYVLDEPTIGLHPRDGKKLVDVLDNLKKLGNPVVVIEHDRDLISSADWLIDLGPGAGQDGGNLIYEGRPDGLMSSPGSLTGQYLAGSTFLPAKKVKRRKPSGLITIEEATLHNMKGIDVDIPLGALVSVTGVSGSGKSTLVEDILYRSVSEFPSVPPGKIIGASAIRGLETLEKILLIDQSPIGRSPRSNPVSYVKGFSPIRKLFSETVEARKRGYSEGKFSFNTEGGRCPECKGEGFLKVEMYFMADIYLPCEECGSTRYKPEVLAIAYKGKNINQVLNMTVDEALNFFSVPAILEKLWLLKRVGLGYLKLGQPATTLSGGEAQRVKIARELGEGKGVKCLFILDEPTVGLHMADVAVLLKVLNDLVDKGNTVLVVEHNIDVIWASDYVIDLGPDGGEEGGRIVAQGTPEEIMSKAESHTGKALRSWVSY
ncbi:MAG: excinuclease ABC subunit UvrA [Candidatus Eisenbacteria bacterium]|nr:excinuclease ABC subunit UvrA [Candidatus Eisenbacteria bacterium]